MPYFDPTGRARAATVALIVYMIAQAGEMAATALTPPGNPAAGIAALILFVVMIVTVVLTAMWIYRVNANAHSFANGLTITPGWNVGWFFIPFANLWKPFEGLREVWRASSAGTDWAAAPVPLFVTLWWACWIIGNMIANASFQAERISHDLSLVATLDLVSSALLLLAAGLLVRIIAVLSRMQPRAHAEITFS